MLASWAETSEVLAWRGIVRAPAETFDEFARRVERLTGTPGGESTPALRDDVSLLAAFADRAAFARNVDQELATSASEVSGQIHRRLLRSAAIAQLASWGLLPRPGARLA